MPFSFEKLDIKDVILIKPKVFSDDRGFFLETYKKSDFISAGINVDFIQDNYSYSVKNVLRGLHYQINPFSQGKLIKVIKGEILDVAVDLRADSPTFKKSVSYVLSDKNNYMLYIPEGFAHGFAVLSEEAYFSYKCTKEYSFNNERGIRFDDPEINIDWKIKDLIISQKDLELPLLKDAVLF